MMHIRSTVRQSGLRLGEITQLCQCDGVIVYLPSSMTMPWGGELITVPHTVFLFRDLRFLIACKHLPLFPWKTDCTTLPFDGWYVRNSLVQSGSSSGAVQMDLSNNIVIGPVGQFLLCSGGSSATSSSIPVGPVRSLSYWAINSCNRSH